MSLSKSDSGSISTDRISDHCLVYDICLCPICQNILWKPVACKVCENAFCSKCITTWLYKQYRSRPICPFNCNYRERKCPSILLNLLSKLKVDCRYKSIGCENIICYEALERHEDECQYQMKQCKGCEKSILLKDLDDHENECDMIDVICCKCQYVYKQKEMKNHNQIRCLENIMERKMEEALKKQQQMFEQKLKLLEENYREKLSQDGRQINNHHSNYSGDNLCIHNRKHCSVIEIKQSTIRQQKRRHNAPFNPFIFYK
ncbi:unnamed protein product [Didymodactylos carnosus]|uniref:RING-type domain-containing protein n=1 Tax=Didymodactylos carnosus TaxID=1234261 RepID=A0A814G341_9BILA|nr:unnamed protein product [Didymodactylos carnosus]CAF1105247.1 unnamed protein product [Didymodactylos carnosus]CAF3763011.1 unnamed protein product [Didymodactylos carnosus]CAF3868274.1 unnamed protein product [Didymodactylos carnosus]